MSMENDKDQEPTTAVPQDVADEIEAGVESAVNEMEAERAKSTPPKKGDDELPPNEDQDGDEKGGDDAPDGETGEGDDGAGDGAITNTLVERAVKAGLSIDDAQAFKTADALERVCATLEKRAGGSGEGAAAAPAAGEGDGGGDDDPLAALEDLDPAVYDEKIVETLKVLKSVIKAQHTEIKGLRAGSGKGSFVDEQVASLGDGYGEALGGSDRSKWNDQQKANRASLDEKLKVLEAGYKAAGKAVSREEAFKEAVSLTLPDVKAQNADADRAARLGKRRTQHIQRPAGAGVRAATDAFDDVAGELDRKFFDKK